MNFQPMKWEFWQFWKLTKTDVLVCVYFSEVSISVSTAEKYCAAEDVEGLLIDDSLVNAEFISFAVKISADLINFNKGTNQFIWW